MASGKHISSYLILNVVLLIVLLGMVSVIFNFHRYMLAGHVLLLAAILLFSIIGASAIFSGSRYGGLIMTIVFAVIIIDIVMIRGFSLQLSMLNFILIVSLIGFFISIGSISDYRPHIRPDSPIEDSAKKDERRDPKADERMESKASAAFKPGKFVGSRLGTTYHKPNSEWGKRIQKANRVWFSSEEDAKAKGYKPHSSIARN